MMDITLSPKALEDLDSSNGAYVYLERDESGILHGYSVGMTRVGNKEGFYLRDEASALKPEHIEKPISL